MINSFVNHLVDMGMVGDHKQCIGTHILSSNRIGMHEFVIVQHILTHQTDRVLHAYMCLFPQASQPYRTVLAA
jgi:hypothetical protein